MDSQNDDKQVINFCEITGIDYRGAQFLLSACNFDLHAALEYYLEVGTDLTPPFDQTLPVSNAADTEASTSRSSSCTPTPGPSTSSQDSSAETLLSGITLPGCEEELRPPIMPKEDVLIDSSAALALNRRITGGLKRGSSSSIFDSFRDFRVEGNRQEELLGAGGSMPDQRKIRRLEDIFRPPLEMMFHGTFERLRDAGVLTKRFVMVNIQKTSEFPCQVLNRDIWSDSVVKMLISENFLFWQVYHDTVEGSMYRQFYPVERFPYVAIIDPRTGELVHSWNTFALATFVEEILQFIQNNPNPFPQPSGECTEKVIEKITATEDSSAVSVESVRECDPLETCSGVKLGNGDDDTDKQEESLREDCSSVSSNEGTVDENSLPLSNVENGNCSPKIVRIRLQYPDQSRELLTFHASGKLQLLQSFLKRKGYPPDKFQYVTYMPKRALNKPQLKHSTFDELGILHESVYVHPVTHKDDV